MKTTKVLAVLMGAVGLTACCSVSDMLSLNAFYEDRDVVFDPALLGAWTMEDELVRIERSGEDGYRVVEAEAEAGKEDDPLFFKLLYIGGIPFIDLSSEGELGHQLAKLVLRPDHIEVSMVDSGWLKRKVVDEGQLEHRAVRHADCTVTVITSPTRDLQFFLLRYATVAEAFEQPIELVRLAGTPR